MHVISANLEKHLDNANKSHGTKHEPSPSKTSYSTKTSRSSFQSISRNRSLPNQLRAPADIFSRKPSHTSSIELRPHATAILTTKEQYAWVKVQTVHIFHDAQQEYTTHGFFPESNENPPKKEAWLHSCDCFKRIHNIYSARVASNKPWEPGPVPRIRTSFDEPG